MRKISFLEFDINLDTYEVQRSGTPIEIGARPLDVLIHLIQNRDRVVSRDQLRSEVWRGADLSAAAIPTAVMELRKSLGDDAAAPRIVGSVRGRGYRFLPEISSGRTSRTSSSSLSDRLEFVGRAREIGVMRAAAREVQTLSAGRVLVISGEAGIGKTRLLEEFELSQLQPWLVLTSQCSNRSGAPPFWPVIQALKHALRTPQGEAEKVVWVANQLARIHPELAVAVSPQQPHRTPIDRFELFELWISAFRALSDTAPVALAFEDVHLADSDSLDLLSCLAEEIHDSQILMIVTHRPPTQSGKGKVRLGEISSTAHSIPVDLSPLSADDLSRLLEPTSESTHSLARSLAKRTSGIPFYVNQLVRYLDSRGTINNLDLSVDELPLSGQEIIGRQLSDLPEETLEVLRIGSLVGERFDAVTIASVSRSTTSEIVSALSPAVQARILLEDHSGFRFSHSILKEALAQTLEPAQKRNHHKLIADSLVQLGDEWEKAREISDQLALASPISNPQDTASYSAAAGREAASQFAYAIAAKYLRRAIDFHDLAENRNSSTRCELMLDLGSALLFAGMRSEGTAALLNVAELARKTSNSGLYAKAALLLAPEHLSIEVGTRDPRLISMLEECLNQLPDDASPLRSRVMARLSQALLWTRDPNRSARLASESLRLAERTACPVATFESMSAGSDSLHAIDRIDERLILNDRLHRHAISSGNLQQRMMTIVRRTAAFLDAGQIHMVDASIAEASEVADSIGASRFAWYPKAFRAMRALMRGDLSTAESLGDDFVGYYDEVRDANIAATRAAQQSVAAIERGEAGAFVPLVSALVAKNPLVYAWIAGLGYMQLRAGDREASRKTLDEIDLGNLRSVTHEPGASATIAFLAEIAIQCGTPAQVQPIYDVCCAAPDYRATLGFGIADLGCFARYAGRLAARLGRNTEAISHLGHALRLEVRCDAALWAAHTEIDLYEVKRNAGLAGPSEAESATRVLAFATDRGLTRLAERATFAASRA